MKVGTGRDKYPVMIKISFYPLTNKSPVLYLFGEIHVNAKIEPHPQKQNKIEQKTYSARFSSQNKENMKKHLL